MFYKLLILISIFHFNGNDINCETTTELNSNANAIRVKDWVEKQWSHWPSGQWSQNPWQQSMKNTTHWPTAAWKPQFSTTSPWWPTMSPVNQRPPTKYPPIPGLPTHKPPESIEPIAPEATTHWQIPTRPPTQPPTQAPTHKPQTQRPSEPTPDSGITVKSCGLSHIPQVFIGNKIVSGKVAKGGEFPWQVLLKIHTARGPMQCGGAILNSRWVLTAAHCVSNERDGTPTAQRVEVTAGVTHRLQASSGSQQRTSDCVIQHESWTGQTGKFRNDIALLRIPSTKPFELNYESGGHINGICLPTIQNSEYTGKARISGWGLTKDRGSPSDILLYTDVSVLSNDKCRKYPYPVPIADGMMCQGVDMTAPCQGDSGGPLIISSADHRGTQRMVEIGVVSFGPGKCANTETPNAIYTKTSHYLKWIESKIKANAGAKCLARELDVDEKIDITVEESETKPQINDSFVKNY